MNYISTRGGVTPIAFQDAVMMGLADDGGLLVPESIPDVRARFETWRQLAYADLAMEIIGLYVDDIPKTELNALIQRTYLSPQVFDPAPAPLARVGDIFVLELWHGPTLSFKDIALQFLGNLFEYILSRRGGRLNILGATSGDTGSAAICGVRGRKGIDIFMMHPAGRVSAIQQRQMTTVLDDNVHNIAVDGTFDDCQGIMKTLAADLDFKRRYGIGAVNSVNWARVLAQIVYYFHAAFEAQRLTGAANVRFAVPTGNFGDVLAGWYAMQMGAPIDTLILATNENDILARFFNSGTYSRGSVAHTISPAMDIQVASNFERYLFHKIGRDSAKLRELMQQFAATGSLSIPTAPGGRVDESILASAGTTDQCLATIAKYYKQHHYVLDPHTAVAVSVAERLGAMAAVSQPSCPTICLSTAHGSKFPDAIRQATAADPTHHPSIDALANLPERCAKLPNDPAAVREFIAKTVKLQTNC
ncbi:MAG: threonine synthase [Planctomycetaceae bacterium]|nr:threonine synthase [Planctomycetaceae bacterium]